jgi:hypothetical protein
MKPLVAKTRFLERLEAVGLSLDALTPAPGIEAMLAYYVEERAEGCDIDADGDMLLFQWGTHDWGDGPAFEVNITRQLIVAEEEAEGPRQLGLTFRFGPSVGEELREGNRWCESPDALPEFRRFIAGSAALRVVGQRSPESVELRYERT